MRLAVLAALLAAGCARTAADLPAGSVRLAPGVVLALPGPSELGQRLQAAQLVTATYGKQTMIFGAHISATPDQFTLNMSLDPIGQTLATLTWSSQGLVTHTGPQLPPQLRPANVLADVMLIYWPEAAVRRALAASDAVLAVGTGFRSVSVGGKEMIHVAYDGSDPWNGSLTYHNLAWGYELAVESESVETAQ